MIETLADRARAEAERQKWAGSEQAAFAAGAAWAECDGSCRYGRTEHGVAELLRAEVERLRVIRGPKGVSLREALVAAERERDDLRAGIARAWDEGHRVGWEHHQDGNHGNDYWDDGTPNPYALLAGPGGEAQPTEGQCPPRCDVTIEHGHEGSYVVPWRTADPVIRTRLGEVDVIAHASHFPPDTVESGA